MPLVSLGETASVSIAPALSPSALSQAHGTEVGLIGFLVLRRDAYHKNARYWLQPQPAQDVGGNLLLDSDGVELGPWNGYSVVPVGLAKITRASSGGGAGEWMYEAQVISENDILGREFLRSQGFDRVGPNGILHSSEGKILKANALDSHGEIPGESK